jgi:hypothetical protein
MKTISEINYFRKLSKLQKDVIDCCPCDPDITSEQIKSHNILRKFKEETKFNY